MLLDFVVMSYLHTDDFSMAKLHLNSLLASINTLVLITSGWFAAEASRAREDMLRRWSLAGSAALGLVFALVKLLEYQDEIRFLGDATFNPFFDFTS
ncbi:hypothetical protein P6U16_22015 (plasmid) [Rhizobium sp. 32-5/1]|uniref:hypothetical protein n=1 Tax=Rhizobium sp. 32-5/1 TaxID=3019602 RepID=UPI00240E7749|nr:hypothetical protein [Rhizobium sp. 32-5/1]WEZ85733.1 hypothetical protein P6U16_22015 [Rhizobium sp. 32-5/1]